MTRILQNRTPGEDKFHGFLGRKCRIRGSQLDELRAQKHVQIRKICPKFCIFNRRESVENGLFRCLIRAINRHFPTPKWPDLPCFLAKGSRKSFAGQISGRATVAPVKNDDFGGVFLPPCGQAVFVTENISRNGKHSLLSPEHIMFRGLKNGSNITSRSRLFAGQSEEANHPFPKPTSGTKSTKKGRSGGVLFKKAD